MYVIVMFYEQRVIGSFDTQEEAQHWLNLRPQYDNLYQPVEMEAP